MRKLLFILFVLAVVVLVVGFYRGWFTASTGDTAHGVNVSIGVDQEKIREDEAKVKEKVHGLGGKAKDAPGQRTDPPRDQDRQP